MIIIKCNWPTALLATSLVTLSTLAWSGATKLPAQSEAQLTPLLSKEGADVLSLNNIADAATALNAPFDTPIRVRLEANKEHSPKERQVNDCKALLPLTGKIIGTVDIADWGVLLRQQASCEALRALTSVRPASTSAMPSRPWPVAWKALTDPALWPADVLPQMDDEATSAKPVKSSRTLKQAHGGKPWHLETGRYTPEGTLALKDSAATIQLQALARGDFDGDGQQDWLVLWFAHATGGSWEGVRAAVLSRPIGQKMITLTWLPLAP
jgi:hypothetical protein